MIIIETCPKCGHDLMDSVICTNPPIPRKECHHCGWYWEGQREQILRVPFVDNNDSPYATMDFLKNDTCCKSDCDNNFKEMYNVRMVRV